MRPTRLLVPAALAALLAGLVPGPTHPARLFAQIIQIKTLPIADGDQWQIFPSANHALGGLSIALHDSLLDPFVNPAKGSRVSEGRRGLFFGSPTFYSLSKNAGGGRTLPLGGIVRSGATFGGLALAVQEIDTIRTSQQVFFPTEPLVIGGDGTPLPPAVTPPRRNEFAFATLGRRFERAGLSVGVSALWSHLNAVDGVDMLYAGSRSIDQHGGTLDLRLGVLKEFARGRTLEGILLHDSFDMTHDVTWADQVWDPNARTFTSRARLDRNRDRTDTWGMHLGASQPLGDAAWRIGAIVTGNLMSHPSLPNYQVAQVRSIPWDPGYTTAFDLGVGVAKVEGPTTFGAEAILEPIRTHTWGDASDSIVTPSGTIPVGGRTTENWFRFANAILRVGAAEEVPLETLNTTLKALRLEAGLALRSIAYTLDQTDHTTLTSRTQNVSWMEWTPTWGLVLRFADLEVRYSGGVTTGTGRPGVVSTPFPGIADSGVAFGGQNFIAPPGVSTTLTGVAVTTHRLSVSVPIR